MVKKGVCMKQIFFLMLLLGVSLAQAESTCDVRMGESIGLKVVEFATGNVIHSKMALRDTTPSAIVEEMVSLQDMGVCTEKVLSKKCILKFEKKNKLNEITLYRGQDRWQSWVVAKKDEAQGFVRGLKRLGFCS